MRIMIFLMATGLIMPGVATAKEADQIAAKPICQKAEPQTVARLTPEARIHPLNRELNAQQVLTVLRTFDGCAKPVVIREDVGAVRPPNSVRPE